MGQVPDDDILVAQATLFLLEASARGPYTKIRYRFGTTELAGSSEDALERLVRFPKPAHCIGSVKEESLEIRCTRADPEMTWRDPEGVLARVSAHIRGMDQPEHAMLLLRRGSKSMLFPLRCFRQWFAEYRLQDYSMSARSGDELSRELGAAVVLEIGPPPRIVGEEIR